MTKEEIQIYNPDLGLDGTIEQLLDWSYRYDQDYSDEALLEIGRRAKELGLPKEKYRIPELVLKDRIRSKEKPDTLPFETLQLNQLIDGKISFSETKDYGEVEIWTENDRVVVSITGVDDEGTFTAAATCSIDDFMNGEDKFLETFIGSVLYYNKMYQED